MNAAAALVAAGHADSLADAMPLAVKSIDTGSARSKLGALVEFTNRRYLYFCRFGPYRDFVASLHTA